MWLKSNKTLSLALGSLAVLGLQSASAMKVTLTSQCADEFILSHVGVSKVISENPFSPGSFVTKDFPMGTSSQVFKAGTGGQATLAEITVDGGKVWIDISIIPTGDRGPDHCMGLDACKQHTGGVGYNFPMQMIPSNQPSREFPTCTTITCMYDGCPEAYLFPDDEKTRVCPANTDVQVIFCPGGPGSKTDSPTPPLTTPAPTTPVPTTPEPTTPAPAVNESDTLSFDGFLGGIGSGSTAVGVVGEVPDTVEVVTPVPVVDATPVAAPQEEVQEVTTRSSADASTGAGVYILGGVGAAAGVAASAIFVLRKKKIALVAMGQKMPRSTTATAFMLSTPQESTIL